MRQFCSVLAVAIATFAPMGLAQQAGPYKVLKTARVGGEGGWDYIYADVAGRRLYIPRRGFGRVRHVADPRLPRCGAGSVEEEHECRE